MDNNRTLVKNAPEVFRQHAAENVAKKDAMDEELRTAPPVIARIKSAHLEWQRRYKNLVEDVAMHKEFIRLWEALEQKTEKEWQAVKEKNSAERMRVMISLHAEYDDVIRHENVVLDKKMKEARASQ